MSGIEGKSYEKQGQPIRAEISHSENSMDRGETSKLIADDSELQKQFYGSDTKERDANTTGKAVSTLKGYHDC